MEIKVGNRLRSVACTTEVIVVKAPGLDVDIRCGGHPMIGNDEVPAPVEPIEGLHEGAVLGKRYEDASLGLELLVTKGGSGSLAVGDQPLTMKEPKRLPSSD